MLRGIVVVGVFVAIEDVDRVAADAKPRAEDDALVDGVANRSIGRACALGAHVSLGCIAGHHVVFGGLLGKNGAPGNRFLDGLQILCAGVQEEVNMRIDQARHER